MAWVLKGQVSGPPGHAAQKALGNVSGAVPINLEEAIDTDVTATLTGNTTLSFTNVKPGKSRVTLFLAQDGTGGRTLTHPSGTDFFSGQDGSINEDVGAVSVVTYVTLDGGTTWLVDVADERPVYPRLSGGANADFSTSPRIDGKTMFSGFKGFVLVENGAMPGSPDADLIYFEKKASP